MTTALVILDCCHNKCNNAH